MTYITKIEKIGYDLYYLSNDQAFVSICSYGASLMSFALKGEHNAMLTYQDETLYKDNPLYLGCIVGRHAGRIGNAMFTINDQTYHLSKNVENKHQLHSGLNGAHSKNFTGTIIDNGVVLQTTLPDGEDGFPRDVELNVRYLLIGTTLHMDIVSTSSQKTVLSFTNHAYFNLNEKKTPITNHQLTLDSEKMMALDDELIPKEMMDIKNTVFDFRKGKPIGQDIDAKDQQLILGNGYDHPFLLAKEGVMTPVATLENDAYRLTIETDQPAIIFYAGNFLDGTYFPYRCGVCLETSLPPNAMHVKTGIDPFRTSNVQKTRFTLFKK